MKDKIDFRISEDFAIGHDELNTIIFRRHTKTQQKSTQFDGESWRAVRFVHSMKRIIIRDLREFGVHDPDAVPGIAAMPENLIDYRKALGGSGKANLGGQRFVSHPPSSIELAEPENVACGGFNDDPLG